MGAMNLLESLLPSVLVNWTPVNHYGYSERHALLFRLNSSIQRTVYDALRDRRLKMIPSRFLGGSITLWKTNQDFRIREHIELVDDILPAFSKAFFGVHPWKLIIVDKKNLAILVCDSLLFPVLTEAARITTNSCFLNVPSIYGSSADRSSARLETHFFHEDPTPLKLIAMQTSSSVQQVFITVLIQSLWSLREDFDYLLHTGSEIYTIRSLPRDPVSCLRHCSRKTNKPNVTIDASTANVASLTYLEGNQENNLLWHLTSASHHIGLSVNVVSSNVDGLMVNFSSNRLHRERLETLAQSFNSNLTYLMMAFRIPWPDTAPLDAKLNLHFNTLHR